MEEDAVDDQDAVAGQRATLATVAASAGVSVATVSKVLNGRSDVAPATRARVAGPARASTTTSADAAARAGPAQPTVELIFDGELNAYSLEIVQGVLDAGGRARRRRRR